MKRLSPCAVSILNWMGGGGAGCYDEAKEDWWKVDDDGLWICTYCNLTIKNNVLKWRKEEEKITKIQVNNYSNKTKIYQ